MSDEGKELSRRKFLRGGLLTAGAVAVGAGVLAPFDQNVAIASPTDPTSTNEPMGLPWPYTPLDPEATKALAYEGYYARKCSYGVFYAIIKQLQDKIGYPYTMIPMEILAWGEGGGAGWGTLCGALCGANTALGFIVGPKQEDMMSVVAEILGWYTDYSFPTYLPPDDKARVKGALPSSISGSPLCHVSVAKWCDVSGFKAEGKQRSERCGRVTADVAAKTVEILNAWHEKKFVPVYKQPESWNECMSCHGKGKSLENARGKMDCVDCHTDVNPSDLLSHIKKAWNIKD
ncbi:C-GCAxxG-C-C family protein [Desulfitobacterium sp.]|uniref:C-GCAxxG-C-C family protein n=1 Tax=Desulfitobacterium sp. TaxID=49981 RepID=UPI002B1EF475|nr:C-GCAxxG-C-C family protein [Desulfitobacterium sp.]MEA4902411.1 C-GCAxxG-C-C family protein [Desulfitobacterium sp.]